MKKVTIMCRVSSDEQAKGYSLDDQLERITLYCERNNYEIVHVIKEDHSAKSFERPEWNKWMQLVKSKKLKTDEILFTSWDRFSRDLTGALNMINTLRNQGIIPQSVEQPIDYAIPENLFMLAIYLANPDVDNQLRSIKVKGGIRKGKKSGYWAQRPPLGYLSVKGTETKHIIVPDPDNAWVVKHIFESVAKGIQQKQIRDELAVQGVSVSRNNMSKILRNKVYAGIIVVPAKEDEPEKLVEGKHEAIVSEELFFTVQSLLQNKRKERKQAPKYALLRDDFPLRGVLNCNSCGETMTASASRGKLGKRYGYYHCNHCKEQRVSVKEVHNAFTNLLESIQIDKNAIELYQAFLDQELGGSKKENDKIKRTLQTELEGLNERLIKMQDLLLDGKLDAEDYSSMKMRYNDQIQELKQKMKSFGVEAARIKEFAQSSLNLLANLPKTFNNANVRIKQRIVGSIFPQNISYDGKICRTPQINPVITLFASVNADFTKKETGLIISNFDQSLSAERRGFEPRVPFRGTLV